MLTITLSILILAVLGYFLLWRLFRSTSACVERAILATGQILQLDTRPGERLTPEQRARAYATAMGMTRHLLGRWRCMLLCLALGRWDLSGWLGAEIEGAIGRLKSTYALPMSIQAAKARNPMVEWAETLMHSLLATYAPRASGPGSPFGGPGFGSTPQA